MKLSVLFVLVVSASCSSPAALMWFGYVSIVLIVFECRYRLTVYRVLRRFEGCSMISCLSMMLCRVSVIVYGLQGGVT